MRAFALCVLFVAVVMAAAVWSEPATAGSSATVGDGYHGAKRERCGGRERSVLKRERCGGMKIFDGSGLFNRRGCGG